MAFNTQSYCDTFILSFSILVYFIAFSVISLFFTYCFLYLLSAVKHFGTPKWIVVKGCINKLHLHNFCLDGRLNETNSPLQS